MNISSKEIVSVIMALIMLITLLGLLYRSIKLNKGIGARTIQFFCIGFLVPTIILLANETELQGMYYLE